MEDREILKQMFLMQQRLNDETNGKKWEEGTAQNGKLINWKRCIYMECAELIDSFSWKHWKSIHQKANKENIKIELTDIWHFIMSLVLERAYPNKDFDSIIKDIVSVSGYRDFTLEAYSISEYNMYEIINDIEIIIHECSGFNLKIHELLTHFFRLSLKCGLNLNELYEKYVGKNVLNKFRQDNGYQDGSYKKIWNNKEDNEVLNEILKSGVIKMDEIYKKLNEIYKNIK